MNFLDTYPLWAWLTTGGGIVGLGLFAFFAPVLAGKIVAGILQFFGEIIRTPLGAGIVAGALAFGAGWFWQGIRSEAICNQRIEDMRQAARDAADERDTAIGKIIDNKFGPIASTLEAHAGEMQNQVKAYETKMASQPTKCPVGDAALRLRNNRR